MKIIIIHYRYYNVSGPEKYLFNISNLLTEKGNEVIPFSLNYPENIETEYSKYFPKPIFEKFHLDQNSKQIPFFDKWKIVKNSFYNKQVYKCLQNLIDDVNPDLVYVLQYGTKLSTSNFDVCTKNKIPVVLRLSDYNLLCAKNIFFRNGEICTKCINNKIFSVKYKCVHNSYSQSFIYYMSQKVNEIRKFENQVNSFIAPSKFTIDVLKKSKQFSKSKFYHIPTFLDNFDHLKRTVTRNYDLGEGLKLCYIGRIADDKGIDVLINAINVLVLKGFNITVDIYGEDNNDYAKEQKILVRDLELNNISFKGFKQGNEINEIFQNYHFSVIPSKWFDNMPNSLIESCLNGVPVIVSNIGSLEELIENGYNGYTFQPLSFESLALKIESLFSITEEKYKEVSNNTFKWVETYCDRDVHYNKLINVFNELHGQNN